MDIQIPGYQILSKLGEGAMGTVYLALQESLQRKVALKVMHAWLTSDPSFRERFLKEGRIVAQLKHNNIVTIHDIGHHGDRYFMDMEYAGGGSLSERLAQGVPEQDVLRIVVEIARALSYAHKRSFIHRDIKPENILFRDDGTPLLSDFGIAKALTGNTQLTVVGSAIGTPDYMSPEQAMGDKVSPQSDIYSLGVTLYEALTGGRPFKADSAFAVVTKHVNDPVPALPGRLRHLQAVIDKCMAKRPAERFASADDLVVALLSAGGGVSGTDHTVLVSPRNTSPGGFSAAGQSMPPSSVPTEAATVMAPANATPRRKGVWVAAGLAALVAIGGVWLWQHRAAEQPVVTPPDGVSGGEIITSGATLERQFALLEQVAGDYRRAQALAGGRDVTTDALDWSALTERMRQVIDNAFAVGQSALAVDLAQRALVAVPSEFAPAGWRDVITALRQPRSLSPQQNEQVARLLTRAQNHLAAGRFTVPEGANALATLRTVLRIDPENAEARRQLGAMADRFDTLARSKYADHDNAAALRYVEIGLMIAPYHEGLIALQRRASDD
ncbi:MAG: serine/threonine protein kinase [Gammaproteobacteria bacterium]|nr:serine/threonine protein kinase [Gammaproteobacteria bacterium]